MIKINEKGQAVAPKIHLITDEVFKKIDIQKSDG